MKRLILLCLFLSTPAFAFEATITTAAYTAATAYLSHVTSGGDIHKETVIRQAEEDAAAFLAGGDKTALLEQAMGYVREMLQEKGFDQKLNEAELALLVIDLN